MVVRIDAVDGEGGEEVRQQFGLSECNADLGQGGGVGEFGGGVGWVGADKDVAGADDGEDENRVIDGVERVNADSRAGW